MSSNTRASIIAFSELLPALSREVAASNPATRPTVVFDLNAGQTELLVQIGTPGKRVALRFNRKRLSMGLGAMSVWYCARHQFGGEVLANACSHVHDALQDLTSLAQGNAEARRLPDSGTPSVAPLPPELRSWLSNLPGERERPPQAPPAPPNLMLADQLLFVAGTSSLQGRRFPYMVLHPYYTSLSDRRVPLFRASPRDLQLGTPVIERLTPEELDCLVAMRGCQSTSDDPDSLVVRTAMATRFFRDVLIKGRVATNCEKYGFRLARHAPDTSLPLSWTFGGEGHLQLSMGLVDDQRIRLTDYPLVFDEAACTFSRITGMDVQTLLKLADAPPVPVSHIPAMIGALERANLAFLPPVPATVPRTSRRVVTAPALSAVLSVAGSGEDVRLVAVPWVTYGPHRVPIANPHLDDDRPADLWRQVGQEIIFTPRDIRREREALDRLDGAGFSHIDYSKPFEKEVTLLGPRVVRAKLASTLAKLIPALRKAGLEVELDERLGIQLIRNEAASSYGDLREGTRGTIELDAGVEIEGRRVPIAELLRAALLHPAWQPDGPIDETERVFVLVDDTSLANLPLHRVRDLLAPYLDFFSILGQPEPGRPLRIPRPMLLAAAANTAHRDVFKQFGNVSAFIAAVSTITGYTDNPVPASPPGVNAELRPYQQSGVAWLEALAATGTGGLLADDMGLGKTLQCLTAICLQRSRMRTAPPVLVVAPAAVVSNWLGEAKQFTPALSMLDLTGPERHARFDQVNNVDVVVTNYNLLRIDIEQLERREFSLAIFDEAQYLKTYSGATHQCARRIRYQRALCVTGTPIDNHLGELQAMLAIAVPGLVDDPKHFTRRFRRPIENERCKATSSLLARVIAPFMLRRTKKEVASDLPPRSTVLRFVELGPVQRSLYNKAAAEANRAVWEVLDELGINRTQVQLMSRLTQLRQIACHPPLSSDERVSGCLHSAKIDEMVRHLSELAEQQRRVIVVSEWVKLLDAVGERLSALGIAFLRYTGDETAKQKDDVTRRFQLGTTPVLLLSLKAGGVGITLTAADTVMLASLWWAPGAESQAVDRTHRIGQTMPVTIFKYIVRGTVEEKILEIQSFKRELADAILSGDFSNSKASLSEQDIVDLFGARNAPHSLRDSDVIEGEFEEIPDPPRLAAPPDEPAFDRRAALALVKDWVRAGAAAHGIGLSELARRIGTKPVWFLNRVSGTSLLPPSVLVAVADALRTPLPNHVLDACRAIYGHDPDLDVSH